MSSWSHWFWVTTFLYGISQIQNLQAESLQVDPVEQDETSLQNFDGSLPESRSAGEVWRRARGGFPVTIPTKSPLDRVSDGSVSYSVSRVSVRMGPVRAVRARNFRHNPNMQLKQKMDVNTRPNKNTNKKSAVEIEKRLNTNEIQGDKILLYRSEDIFEEPVILDVKRIEDHRPVKTHLEVNGKVDSHEENEDNIMHKSVAGLQTDKQQHDIRMNHSNSVEDGGSEEEEHDDGEITSPHVKIQRLSSSKRQLSLATLDKLKSLAHVSTAGIDEKPTPQTKTHYESSREAKAIRPSLIQVNPEDIGILPERRQPPHHEKHPLGEPHTESLEIKEEIKARRMFPDGEPLRPMNEYNDQSPALSLLNQRAHKQMAEQKNLIDEVQTDDETNHSIMDMIKAWTDSVQTTKSQTRKRNREQAQDMSMDQLSKAERKETANNTESGVLSLITETDQTFRNAPGTTARIHRNVKQFIEELKKSIEENNKVKAAPKEAENGLPFSGTGRSLPDVSIWNYGGRQGAQKSLLSDLKSHGGMPQILNPREFTNDQTGRDYLLDLQPSSFGQNYQELDMSDYSEDEDMQDYRQDMEYDMGDYRQLDVADYREDLDMEMLDYSNNLDTRDFINDLDTSSSEVHYMEPEDLDTIERSEFMMEVEGEAVKTRLMDVTNIVALTLGTIVFVISVSVGAGVMFYRRQYYLKPEALDDTYSHSDCASCNYTDTEVFQTVSYGDCLGIDIAKENLTEDLNTLDNDSFLNSLEVMAMPEYWNDSVRL